MRHAEQVVVLVASPATIDRDGLHRTNLRLLARALAAHRALPVGLPRRRLPARARGRRPHRAVVGGDHRSASIAAASVIAKTTRDRLMAGPMAEAYPGFGFDQHVGYATPEHHAALRAEGLSPLHRRSFQSMAYPGYAALWAPGPSRRPDRPGPVVHARPQAAEAHRDEVEAHRPVRELRAGRQVGLGRPARSGPAAPP